jgi:hypothetical protein
VHGTPPLPTEGFSLNLIVENFSKICEENENENENFNKI